MKETKPTSTLSAPKVIAAVSAVIVLCCFGILCYSVTLFYVVDKDISLIPTPTIDLACTDTTCLNACMRQLPDFKTVSLSNHREELAQRPGGYELARYRLDEQSGQLIEVATPYVPEYLESYQTDTQLHQRIWSYFTGIFPNDPEMHASYMIVFMDGSEQRPAAKVWQLDGKWRLYVNLLDFDSPESAMFILTHEYGHILTLSKKQLQNIKDEYGLDREQEEFDKMRAQCGDRFFTGYDCTTEKSYLNAFGNRFWSGEVYDAWVKILLQDQDAEANQKALNEFYNTYSDQFVRAYSATNPLEDIADSWTEFVLRPKPSDATIANQKILFFYDYPELVQMRADIIQNICQSAVDQK
jgi:hypothetical protein